MSDFAQQHVCVALSGGVDSMLLLTLAAGLAPALGFSLSAVHVHHGLSPAADDWAAFCQERCAGLGLVCRVVRVSVSRDDPAGLEAAARRERHRVFASVDCDGLVLAHHRDDQAETVLFRLLRGAGAQGLAAMAGRRGRLLRPWLALPRAVLVDEARRRQLVWVEDESNAAIGHRRNFLRHEILPRIESAFPGARKVLARQAAQQAETAGLLADLARIDWAACLRDNGALDRAAFQALGPARGRNLLVWRLREAGCQVPGAARLDETLRQLDAVATWLTLGEAGLGVYRDQLWFFEALPAVPDGVQAWMGEAMLPWGEGVVRFTPVASGQDGGLGWARLAGRACRLGGVQAGLRLRVQAGGLHRPFKQLCQEAGIPPWLRGHLPVLWVDDEPAWIGGLGCSADFRAQAGEAAFLPSWQPAGPVARVLGRAPDGRTSHGRARPAGAWSEAGP